MSDRAGISLTVFHSWRIWGKMDDYLQPLHLCFQLFGLFHLFFIRYLWSNWTYFRKIFAMNKNVTSLSDTRRSYSAAGVIPKSYPYDPLIFSSSISYST